MNIKELFDVFSRRGQEAQKPLKPLTLTFRNRILMLCRDRFLTDRGDYREELWREMHSRISYLLGRPHLSKTSDIRSEIEDVLQFLLECEDAHFLDFIEYIFQIECYWRLCNDDNQMVDEINHFFILEDLPYSLTPFVRETRVEKIYGHPREVSVVVSHPQVILREHEVTHSYAVTPVIRLLDQESFTSANQEFLAALEDYKRGRHEECLTRCGSAFESTMKLICERRKWPYKDSGTTSQLLKVLLGYSTLDSYFEQPLLIIATLRNRLGSAHGAGKKPRSVPRHRALYAINATADAILLLVEECR